MLTTEQSRRNWAWLCLANFVLGLHGFGHADVVYAGPAGQGVAGKNKNQEQEKE
ncbi:hypothetical protein VSS59_06730 [Lactobacillus delbrueckii subsp. allosunkii]